MKFNVSSKALHSYLSAVGKIIGSKSPVSILNHFLFTLDGNMLTVTGSDMENSLEGRLPVNDAEGSGSFCIDARRLTDLLKDIPDQGLSIDIDESTLNVSITFAQGAYNFVAISGDEYPRQDANITEEDHILSFTAGTSKLIRGIDNTLFAVSSDNLRPMMTGIYCDVKPDRMVFVATDTRKLVRFTDSSIQAGAEGAFILPTKTAGVIKTAFVRDDEVEVMVHPKGVRFKSEHFTFYSVIIKGNFPDYNRVIPRNSPYELTIDRPALLNTVRRMSAFVTSGHGLTKFSIAPDMLTITASDMDYCLSARENLMCEFTGTNMTIGFGSTFLIEILNVLGTQDIKILLSDPSRPGVFIPGENAPDTDLLMLLMPMTVTD